MVSTGIRYHLIPAVLVFGTTHPSVGTDTGRPESTDIEPAVVMLQDGVLLKKQLPGSQPVIAIDTSPRDGFIRRRRPFAHTMRQAQVFNQLAGGVTALGLESPFSSQRQ